MQRLAAPLERPHGGGTVRSMLPYLVQFSDLGIKVSSRGTMILLGILFAHWVGAYWVERLEGIDRRQARRAMLWLLPPAFIGARLNYVLLHWEAYADRPLAALGSWAGGMHAAGGIVLMVVALPFVLRRLGIPLGKFADGFAPALFVAIALARLGCFARGCCFGTECRLPWCVSFPPDALPYSVGVIPADRPIHPLQIYFALAAVLSAVVALRVRRRKRWDGQAALVAVAVHSASSSALETLRADHVGRVYWGALPELEWAALVMTGAAVVALGAIEMAHRRRLRAADA